jgi:alkylhydroperoxidase family enzyme
MQPFAYADARVPIRADIPEAHRSFWHRLSGPGSWWTGAERVAIAAETRHALGCAFCAARKQALSPHAVQGEHTHGGGLPPRTVDAVHRIVTDQGRITRRWVDDNARHGLSQAAYVELVGVVVAVVSIDEFHRALGLALEPLPEPRAGEPDRHRPAVLSDDIGFVPTVPPHGAVGREAGLWPAGRSANVIRALTLVPQALRDWVALADSQYLSVARMANFVKDDARSINRMQMELVAARVSAVNECYY